MADILKLNKHTQLLIKYIEPDVISGNTNLHRVLKTKCCLHFGAIPNAIEIKHLLKN